MDLAWRLSEPWARKLKEYFPHGVGSELTIASLLTEQAVQQEVNQDVVLCAILDMEK